MVISQWIRNEDLVPRWVWWLQQLKVLVWKWDNIVVNFVTHWAKFVKEARCYKGSYCKYWNGWFFQEGGL